MTALATLWLPIVLSAVIVFIASSLVHMVLPWHKNDYPKMGNEDKVMDALRPLSIPPGDYMIPRPSGPQDMKKPEFIEKLQKGPVVMMTVFPNGPMSMGSNFVQWFLFCIVISIFSGYLAGRAVPPGTVYLRVFQFVGTAAFMGYALALWQMSIWYKRDWILTLKGTFDGLLYACLTAGTFGWLWPR